MPEAEGIPSKKEGGSNNEAVVKELLSIKLPNLISTYRGILGEDTLGIRSEDLAPMTEQDKISYIEQLQELGKLLTDYAQNPNEFQMRAHVIDLNTGYHRLSIGKGKRKPEGVSIDNVERQLSFEVKDPVLTESNEDIIRAHALLGRDPHSTINHITRVDTWPSFSTSTALVLRTSGGVKVAPQAGLGLILEGQPLDINDPVSVYGVRPTGTRQHKDFLRIPSTVSEDEFSKISQHFIAQASSPR